MIETATIGLQKIKSFVVDNVVYYDLNDLGCALGFKGFPGRRIAMEMKSMRISDTYRFEDVYYSTWSSFYNYVNRKTFKAYIIQGIFVDFVKNNPTVPSDTSVTPTFNTEVKSDNDEETKVLPGVYMSLYIPKDRLVYEDALEIIELLNELGEFSVDVVNI